MILKGSIEDIIYRNEENGYTVSLVNCSGELITAVGKFASANAGEVVELTGNYVKNKKFGEQFSATSVKILPPTSLSGIEKYLSSGLIKGIGEVTAKNIVDTFKEDTLEVIEFNPSKLTIVRGISASKAVKIAEAFKEIKKMQNAVMFLQKYNITTNMAVKIYKKYLDRVEEVLNTNPYKLVEDIDGIGFLTADVIARKLGIPFDSAFRMRAGILHILKENSDKNGNTYLPIKEMNLGIKKLLQLEVKKYGELVESVLNELAIDSAIKRFDVQESPVIMLTKFALMERSIAEKLVLLKENEKSGKICLENEILEYERLNKIEMHQNQKEAVETAYNNGVSVITGGPGTGKTTIIKCIISTFKNINKKVLLLAPTGRAAKKLNESTGLEASTIHRALGVDFQNGAGMFAFNESNKLMADVIIVDEVSMVDVSLMYNLLKAIKRTTKLILVGDKNQLPSVGAGNVLADVLHSEIITTIELTKIYRQDEKSLIVTNAHAINEGAMPRLDNTSKDFFFANKKESVDIAEAVVNLTAVRIPKYLNIDPLKIQVLAPIRLGASGVINLNIELQKVLNPSSKNKAEIVTEKTIYRVGDKIMQIANNYTQEWIKVKGMIREEGKGVYNGDIGFIEAINKETNELIVMFEDGRRSYYSRGEINQIVLSYATTIHKSQGSEFDVVIIPITGGAPSIMTRNLLYTAVTRAKQMVVLVGSEFNLKRMIDNTYTKKRYSMLQNYLLKAKQNIEFLYGA